MARVREANEIIDGMASALWVHAAEAHGARLGGPVKPPLAAKKAAIDLSKLFAEANFGVGDRVERDDYADAMLALYTKHRDDGERRASPEWFGIAMAESALRTPGWRKRFRVRYPDFTVKYDGVDLIWSGGGQQRADFDARWGRNPESNPHQGEDAGPCPHCEGRLHLRSGEPEGRHGAFVADCDACPAEAMVGKTPDGAWFVRSWKPNQVIKVRRVNPESPHNWPASQVQSLLFPKDHYTVEGAKKWAADHGYHYGSVDSHGNYHRLRQHAPGGGPCRTIEFGAGIKAVVCAKGMGKPPGVPNPGCCSNPHEKFSDDLEHWDD